MVREDEGAASPIPQYLEAGSGNRPLIDSSTYTRFDNLRLLCAPFTSTPTRRIADYLVQMAQSARFLRNGWSELAPDYRTCFPLVERLVQLELAYPPSREESLSSVVRKFRDYLVPNESARGLTRLTRAGDSARILYVSSDTDGLAVVRATGRNVRVDVSTSLDSADSLREYNAVVIDGDFDTRDTEQLRTFLSLGRGVVMSGAAPYQLAGEHLFLGPISDWFGARHLLRAWGSAVTPAASYILDTKWEQPEVLAGHPEWRYGVNALSPVGLGPRTVVISWYRNDLAVFSAAVRPDAEHPGRLYYQGSLGEGRCPELDSLYASGIRWAAGLLR